MGDGFVLALQNSWGYEESADRFAVDPLGIAPENLSGALQILRSLYSVKRLRRRAKDRGGLAAIADEMAICADLLTRGAASLRPRDRWRLAWFLFRRQYFHGMTLHYWHPAPRERLKALRADGPGLVRPMERGSEPVPPREDL